MIEEIRSLIRGEKYAEAIMIIEDHLGPKMFDFQDDEQIRLHTELLSLRVTARTLLGEQDDIITQVTRKECSPYKVKIDIGNRKIRLLDKSIMLFMCDAWVNSFHKTRGFDYYRKSFSHALLEKLGEDEINKQLSEQSDKTQNNFYTLKHEHLSAPLSYHIPIYTDAGEKIVADRAALRSGIIAVLDHLKNSDHKYVAFTAMGLSSDATPSEREQLIDFLASTIADYLTDLPVRATFPKIYFPFNDFRTFQSFERIFASRTQMGKYFELAKKELSQNQQNMIEEINTADEHFQEMLRNVSFVVNENSTVLLLGETGCGKSFLAQKIHDHSKRRRKKFASRNVAAMTPSLLRSEIFGHEKGAFTGASVMKKSIFELAEGGTVFLDEIGYADLEVQKSLLTFLDDGTYMRVGGTDELKAEDVRVIFGTNQNLEELISIGEFLHDFYERISTSRKYVIPPLRSRPDNIRRLAIGSVKELNKREGGRRNISVNIQDEAIEQLQTYQWPGNIRQLFNYVENTYYDALYEKKILITKAMIKQEPPRNYRLGKGSSLHRFEQHIRDFLTQWNHNEWGKFRDDFFEPVLAKVYLEDLSNTFNKSDSNKILGIDGSRADSTLDQRYKKYSELKARFG